MRRRTAPFWVRELDDRTCHALTGRLLRESHTQDLSERQDWLLDRCLDELAFRRAAAVRDRQIACTCSLCMPSEWYDPD